MAEMGEEVLVGRVGWWMLEERVHSLQFSLEGEMGLSVGGKWSVSQRGEEVYVRGGGLGASLDWNPLAMC